MVERPARTAAVLDTNVLFPPMLRDMLMYSAWANCYRPVWSDVILEELRRNLVAVAGMTPEAATKRIARLTISFPDASVALPSPPPNTSGVDPKDRHVVAAAVAGKAGLIVTNNLRHFPAPALSSQGIEACVPDEFLVRLLELSPSRMLAALHRYSAALKAPPVGIIDLLNRLSRHVPHFSREARRLL